MDEFWICVVNYNVTIIARFSSSHNLTCCTTSDQSIISTPRRTKKTVTLKIQGFRRLWNSHKSRLLNNKKTKKHKKNLHISENGIKFATKIKNNG